MDADLGPADAGERWRQLWEQRHLFGASGLTAADRPVDDQPRKYVLGMFSYPSGDLHMGHAEVYAIVDAMARFARLRGFNVLNPIGWDSFGLPAENAARKRDLDPQEWTYANIDTQAASFRRLGITFDWRTRLHTSDPDYYRWNQWLFLRLFERGLAYRAAAPVNWCPTDETVLANEQVIDGRCERCRTPVVERILTQWFFRITAYADRLLDDMVLLAGDGHARDGSTGWPADVLTIQRNWIGRNVAEDGTVSLRLRDWLISRQRYWGTPIPIVHCPSCGLVPVPDEDLPVRLPELSGAARRPSGGRTPLEMATEWIATACPKCAGPATRDPDTMDTFVDSSWYFLRYPNPSYDAGPFDPAGVDRWLPVDDYVGGKDHATGHLLYARFITKVLHDLGLVPFVEPFARLTNQGQVIMDGKAMSKSLGNLVDLAQQIDEHGPDAVRVTTLFAGPPEDDIDWADVSPTGSVRWLARVRRLAADIGAGVPVGGSTTPADDLVLRREVHRLVAEVTESMARRRFNVAIARMMSLTSLLRKAHDRGRAGAGSGAGSGPGAGSGSGAASGAGSGPAVEVRAGAEALVRMLSCVAPYAAEEAWVALGREPSVLEYGWPAVDESLLATETVTCVVQIGGVVRDRIEVPVSIGAAELEALALASARVRTALGETRVGDVIVRAPHLVNVVPRA